MASNKHFYKIVISVNEHPTARFESVAFISSAYLVERMLVEGYRLQKVYLNGKKNLRPIYIRRQDVYGGLCEEMCKIRQIIPSLCICHKLDAIKNIEPNLIQELRKPYEFMIGSEGESCSDVCNNKGKLCDSIGINLLNSCSELMTLTICDRCETGNQNVLPGSKDQICYVTDGIKFPCETNTQGFKRGCACKQS